MKWGNLPNNQNKNENLHINLVKVILKFISPRKKYLTKIQKKLYIYEVTCKTFSFLKTFNLWIIIWCYERKQLRNLMFETEIFNASIACKEDNNPTTFNSNEIVEEFKHNLSCLTGNVLTI